MKFLSSVRTASQAIYNSVIVTQMTFKGNHQSVEEVETQSYGSQIGLQCQQAIPASLRLCQLFAGSPLEEHLYHMPGN